MGLREHNTKDKMKALLQTMIDEMVDRPDESKVDAIATNDGNTIVLTIKPAKQEIGKVIGKRGKNISALRTIMEAVAAKYRSRVVLEIPDYQ